MENNMNYDLEFGGTADWARFYRTLKWQIVPAVSPQKGKQWKRPLVEWRPLQQELVPDLTFERWYGASGDYVKEKNIGIITGQASNIVVIDLDIQRHESATGWWQAMQDRQQTAGELETVFQKTGGGGLQYFFKIPAGWSAPTCKTSLGIDIRGQGGFAVIAPSLHESGKNYDWAENCGPHEIDVAECPQWLCEEIDHLAEEFGGKTTTNVKGEKTSSPKYEISISGRVQDGREEYMTRLIWGTLVNLRREAPMINDAFLITEMKKAFEVYEKKTKSRIIEPEIDNAVLLERENRGISLFTQKWNTAAAQWWDKVSDHAKEERPVKDTARPFDPTEYTIDPETGEILLKVSKEPFIAIPKSAFGYSDEDNFSTDNEKPKIKDKYLLIPSTKLTDEQVKWLLQDLIPMMAFVALYGKPGTFKSFVALYLSACVALGLMAFGKKSEAGDVVYIAGEGGAGLKRRLDALRKRHDMPEIPNLYFLKSQLNLRSTMEDLAGLLASIKKNNIKPKLIVIDTLARAFAGGNENTSEDMGAFINIIGLLQQATGSAVMIVHHSGKDEARGQRGHSSLLGAVDAELELTRISDENSDERIGQILVTKQKDGEDGFKLMFQMETVALSAIDPEHKSLALVPIENHETAQKKKKRSLNDNDVSVLKALKGALNDAGEVVGLPQIPAQMRVVNVSHWRNFYYAGNPNSEDTKKKTFGRAVERLVSQGTVCSWANYCWIPNA
jgi:hypothetical protein